eukprot:2108956-Karenia_brevis.AAC.1
MMRKMIGYKSGEGLTWEDIMRDMKAKMNEIWNRFKIRSWSELVLERKFQFSCKILCMRPSRWTRVITCSTYFNVNGKRKHGRPRKRWDDDLNKFAQLYGFDDW